MTPGERERRIEAGMLALQETRFSSNLREKAERTLSAADEAVPMVSLAAVLDVLDRAYHPQMGENPAHPADVIRASFSGEEGNRDVRPGDVIGGRFVVIRGPVAIQGLDGCTDMRCTRWIDRETGEDRGCGGYHCPDCFERTGMTGHKCPRRGEA